MSTDITVNSANSGAITAALKTPTADIKYVPHAPHTKYPPESTETCPLREQRLSIFQFFATTPKLLKQHSHRLPLPPRLHLPPSQVR
jgi:hypothetical protein